MTAKERELLEDNLSSERIDELGGTITKLMRLHTLSIVEKYINVLNLYREYTHLNRCQEYEKAAIVRDKIVKAEQELARTKTR